MTGVSIESDLAKSWRKQSTLLIYSPRGTLHHVSTVLRIKMIIITTGFDDAGKAAIAKAAENSDRVRANMSVGVNVTMKLWSWRRRVFTWLRH